MPFPPRPADFDKIENCKAWLMEKRIIFHGHTRRPIGTPVPQDSQSPAQQIFLLSPANASGIRGTRLLMKVKISPSGPLVVPSLKARSNCARPLARLLSERSGNDTQIVLLGSIATQNYVAPLLDIFGKRLVFPCDFVGRGDMSQADCSFAAPAIQLG